MTRFIRFSHLVVLAVASLPALAQETPEIVPSGSVPVQIAKPPAPVPHNGRITGTVLCADTHHPARGAMVMIMPLPPPDGKEQGANGSQSMTRVANDGTYAAEHMAAGEYAVIAMLPGYLSPIDDLTSAEMRDNSPQKTRAFLARLGTVSVRGRETARYDLSLQRGAAVSGRVLYSDGSPASQIMIDVQDIEAKPPAANSPEDNINAGAVLRALFMRQSQGTDDQGYFRISGLRPGTYRVAAIQPSANPMSDMGGDSMGMSMWVSSNPKDLHVYSGDTLHKKSAKAYELRSGDEVTGIDITIPTDAFHRLTGRVSAKDGRGINSATLTLTDTADDSLVFLGEVNRDGDFLFPTVPTGTYTLAATEAKIGVAQEGYPDNLPISAGMANITNAFADSSTAVIVKESDVVDVNLTLTEVPLPPAPPQPNIQNITGPPQ